MYGLNINPPSDPVCKMADEPESGEREEDSEIEIDVGSYEITESKKSKRRKKSPWSYEEVQIFKKGLELFGHKWKKIADLLETRSALQVKSYANKFFKIKAQEESDSLIMISAITSSVHLEMEETNDELDVEDISHINQNKFLAEATSKANTLGDCYEKNVLEPEITSKTCLAVNAELSEAVASTNAISIKSAFSDAENAIDFLDSSKSNLRQCDSLDHKNPCSSTIKNNVDEVLKKFESNESENAETVKVESKGNEIIPEYEATEICHALVESPQFDLKSDIEDEKLCISIKLEYLRQKDNLKKSSGRLSKENKHVSKYSSKDECLNEVITSAVVEEAEKHVYMRKELRKCSKSENLQSNKLPLRRVTRRSKPIPEMPEELKISIDLDDLKMSLKEESLSRHACVLKTQTLNEGWMMQKDSTEDKKDLFCVNNINVDRNAFGVIKHKITDANGQISEKIEILGSKDSACVNDGAENDDNTDRNKVFFHAVSSTSIQADFKSDNCSGENDSHSVVMASHTEVANDICSTHKAAISLLDNKSKEEEFVEQQEKYFKRPAESIKVCKEKKSTVSVDTPSDMVDKNCMIDTFDHQSCQKTLETNNDDQTPIICQASQCKSKNDYSHEAEGAIHEPMESPTFVGNMHQNRSSIHPLMSGTEIQEVNSLMDNIRETIDNDYNDHSPCNDSHCLNDTAFCDDEFASNGHVVNDTVACVKADVTLKSELQSTGCQSNIESEFLENNLSKTPLDPSSSETIDTSKSRVSENLEPLCKYSVPNDSQDIDGTETSSQCTNNKFSKEFTDEFSLTCVVKENVYIDEAFKYDDCENSRTAYEGSVTNDLICPEEDLKTDKEHNKSFRHDELKPLDEMETESYGKLFLHRSELPKLDNDPFLGTSEHSVVEHSDGKLSCFADNLSERNYSSSSSPVSEEDCTYISPNSQFECAVQLTEIPLSDLISQKVESECDSSESSTDEDDVDSCHDSSTSDSDSESSFSSSQSSQSESYNYFDCDSLKGNSDLDDIVTGTLHLDDDLDGRDVNEHLSPGKIQEMNFVEDSVSPIERKECREFFMGKQSKTPAKYIEIRNFIIREWKNIKPLYLTKNSIRSKVEPADANAAGRVHVFLENHGAINVGCSSKNKWVERMEKRREKFLSSKRSFVGERSKSDIKKRINRVEHSRNDLLSTTEIELDYNEITEDEKRAHPQYFIGNKHRSPDKYLKIRNSIIDCWKDSKPAYLTKQAARMAMSWYCGDVNAISRVHNYLEQVGAINFGCAHEPRRGRPSRARMNQERSASKINEKLHDEAIKKVSKNKIDVLEVSSKNNSQNVRDINLECRHSISSDQENCMKEQGGYSKDQFETIKYYTHEQETGIASDKSSTGDSGFDSISEVSPVLDAEFCPASSKLSGLKDEKRPTLTENFSKRPYPSEEVILDLEAITEEEKTGCIEFFVGSRVKPPEKYVKIRRSIIKSWENRKPYYLNKHNARCEMPWYTGDINSIGRVHSFLESIGAINFGALRKPKKNGRTFVSRKRIINHSPKYSTSSPETEDSYDGTDRTLEDLLNTNELSQFEKDVFNDAFFDGNKRTPNKYIEVRNEILDMWTKCKPKYLCQSEVYQRFIEDFDSLNFVAEIHSFLETSGLINNSCVESHQVKDGLWDDTRRFTLGLRPRKRWKIDINQDWLDKTAPEGFTIKHLSAEEERQESRQRQLICANKIRKSLPDSDPYKLVPCRTFPNDSSTPFTVTICLKALLVMDFHSYLSSSEVIGLVGGKYYHASRRLEIMRVAPCSNVGTNLQCEMDPVSQAKASNDLAQHGLEVVGWYHSHPTFAPTPSLRDIDTQSTFQEWFSRAGAPFVGIIVSPYNMSHVETSHKSQITCLTISDQWDESKSYRIPYMFKFKTEDLEKSDSFDDTIDQLRSTMETVKDCKRYLCEGKLGNSSPGLLLAKSLEAKLNRKIAKKDEFISQVRHLIGI